LVDFAVAEFFGTSARFFLVNPPDILTRVELTGTLLITSEVRSLASMLGAAGLPAMRRFSGPER
jgi:hypothetical protein